jgi:hypothetical protein
VQVAISETRTPGIAMPAYPKARRTDAPLLRGRPASKCREDAFANSESFVAALSIQFFNSCSRFVFSNKRE